MFCISSGKFFTRIPFLIDSVSLSPKFKIILTTIVTYDKEVYLLNCKKANSKYSYTRNITKPQRFLLRYQILLSQSHRIQYCLFVSNNIVSLHQTRLIIMILESVIARVIEQQKSRLMLKDSGLKRELIPATQSLSSHALIISGVRRCGKSTLLMQMMKAMDKDTVLYLNFESPQLYEFSLNDFTRLDNLITQTGINALFFDELQLVDGWEMYVRQKLDEGFKVIITGSNASLLSKELGTRLTGRSSLFKALQLRSSAPMENPCRT